MKDHRPIRTLFSQKSKTSTQITRFYQHYQNSTKTNRDRVSLKNPTTKGSDKLFSTKTIFASKYLLSFFFSLLVNFDWSDFSSVFSSYHLGHLLDAWWACKEAHAPKQAPTEATTQRKDDQNNSTCNVR